MGRKAWGIGALIIWALIGSAQTYGPGEIYYGGIRLQFSGRVVTTGTCASPTQPALGVTQIQCQVPEGAAGTVELTATRTPVGAVNIRVEPPPAGWPTSLWVQQLGQWADSRSAVSSGWGTAIAQYRFTVPDGSAGRQFTLRFKAWTAGVVGELELRLILDIVRAVTPTPPTEPTVPPSYGPFTGTTDATGRFEVPIPTLPNTAVTGKLSEYTVKPLPDQEFTLTLVPKEETLALDDLAGFTFTAPGYQETTVTQFSKFSLFGLTWYEAGPVCFLTDKPPCREVELRVLTQNCQLIPEIWIRTPPVVGVKTTVYGGTPHRDTRGAEFARLAGPKEAWTGFDIIRLQEVFSHAGENQAFKNAIARTWLDDNTLDLTRDGWHTLDRDRILNVGQGSDAVRVSIMNRALPGTDTQQMSVLKRRTRWVVAGPDSTASPRYTIDGGLMILSKHPVIGVSGFTFSDQAGAVEAMSNKGALYARVQLDPDSPECYIHVFNTHLAADGAHADHRREHLHQLTVFIENCVGDPATGEPDGRPIILCGDLNIIGGSQEWSDLLQNLAVGGKALEDVWRKLGKGEQPAEDAATWVGNDQNAAGTPWGGTNALATEPGTFQRLDYILFYAGETTLALTPMSVSREPATRRDRAYAWGAFTLSDHLGVTATFRVQPKWRCRRGIARPGANGAGRWWCVPRCGLKKEVYQA